jgi:hypothetical protein
MTSHPKLSAAVHVSGFRMACYEFAHWHHFL